jgi:mannosyltransferase
MKIDFLNFRHNKQRELLLLIFCLLIGFALRFYTFDQKSLWMDEVHTFNDSRDGLKGQIEFYKENPTYLHPPLFFVLTHAFYPFPKPERDLRLIPLIFGMLSIPMIYFLAKSFSPNIALPCTLSLTFMTYHISLSQEGRSYSLIMFLGMVALYLFMKHLKTSKRIYLPFVSAIYAILFYISYSSIPFIVLSQILWLYGNHEEMEKPSLSSIFILNGSIILLCVPWVLFIALHYKGEPIMNPHHVEGTGSLWAILHYIFNDWVPHAPLMIASIILLILFPFFSDSKKKAFILLAVLSLPLIGLYFFCKLLNVSHFITSRYFISFLPLFLIALYLSVYSIEIKLGKKFIRFTLLFVLLFIASNLVILPLYYRSEKQDLRGLTNYLKAQLQERDKIFISQMAYMPGILHYFGGIPRGSTSIDPFLERDRDGNRIYGTLHLQKQHLYR